MRGSESARQEKGRRSWPLLRFSKPNVTVDGRLKMHLSCSDRSAYFFVIMVESDAEIVQISGNGRVLLDDAEHCGSPNRETKEQ